MNRIIINADDCGRSQFDDDAIEMAIQKGLITSTTVIANMDDLNGAVTLYEKYKDWISFGIHLNLSEGKPFTNTDVFLKSGFCIEEKGNIVFGFIPNLYRIGPFRTKMRYQYTPMSRELKKSIYEEVKAQINKLNEVGIDISHIDSHNHMHLSPSILPIVCKVAHECNLTKMRRGVSRLDYTPQSLFYRSVNSFNNRIMKGFKQTDIFCTVKEFYKIVRDDDKAYEVMCHPGITFGHYPDEIKTLEDNIQDIRKKYKLITYNEL